MALSNFERGLEDLIGRPSSLRPFVCDGSPLETQVFIVGINPATAMEEDFWSYWRTSVGFDKGSWFKDYKRHREQQPLKLGRTRREAVSRTRRMLDLVVAAAEPVRCLETNLFSTASPTADELPGGSRLTAVFDFLVEAIQPGLIVAHGADPAAHIQQHVSGIEVWSVRHLSRGWSLEAAAELGAKIKSRVHASEQKTL